MVGGFFQTSPVCEPPPPSNLSIKQTQSLQLNKPLRKVTRSLVGGMGLMGGVCNKDLIKKIEILTIPFSLELLGNASNLSLDCLRAPET